MIIELYGLPASGKSTFAKKMEDEGYVIIKIKNRKELLFYNLVFFVKYPIKTVVAFMYLIINFGNAKLFYYKLMNVFLDKNAKYEKAVKYEKAIIDQGHFQNVISLFDKKLITKQLIRYIGFMPLPDKLFVFSIDHKERKKMGKQRGYSAREDFGLKYQTNWKETIEYNDKLLKDNLKNIKVNHLVINSLV